MTAKRVALEDLRLRVDDVSGSGRVAAALADPVAIEGELALGRVDLTPYLPPAAAGRPACFRQAASGGADGGLVRCADRFAAAPAGRRRFPPSRRGREGTAARARRGEHEAAGGPAASHRHHRRVAGLWRAAHRQRAGDPGQSARLCARTAEPGHRPARHTSRADRQGASSTARRISASGSRRRETASASSSPAWAATARSCCATGRCSASTSPACCARS